MSKRATRLDAFYLLEECMNVAKVSRHYLDAGFGGLAVRVGTSILLHRAWWPVALAM